MVGQQAALLLPRRMSQSGRSWIRIVGRTHAKLQTCEEPQNKITKFSLPACAHPFTSQGRGERRMSQVGHFRWRRNVRPIRNKSDGFRFWKNLGNPWKYISALEHTLSWSGLTLIMHVTTETHALCSTFHCLILFTRPDWDLKVIVTVATATLLPQTYKKKSLRLQDTLTSLHNLLYYVHGLFE